MPDQVIYGIFRIRFNAENSSEFYEVENFLAFKAIGVIDRVMNRIGIHWLQYVFKANIYFQIRIVFHLAKTVAIFSLVVQCMISTPCLFLIIVQQLRASRSLFVVI